MSRFYKNIKDLRHLNWTAQEGHPGIPGMLLKTEDHFKGHHFFLKLGSFDYENGEVGYDAVNELLASRLLDILGFEHVEYNLVTALIRVGEKEYIVHPCISEDFREPGDRKVSLENYYELLKDPYETPIHFCERQAFRKQIYETLILDFLILNRDRHGGNIEVILHKDSDEPTLAPIFDNGFSLIYFGTDSETPVSLSPLREPKIQSFVGGNSAFQNLQLISADEMPDLSSVSISDVMGVTDDLDSILTETHIAMVQQIIMERIHWYEILRVRRQRGQE